jgi:hypothetical protein
MKRIRRTRRKAHQHSLVLGLLYDLRLVVFITAWPVRTLAVELARLSRRNPRLKWLHDHHVHQVAIGFLFVVIAFLLEDYSHHAAWKAGVETVRAVGVAPLWEVVVSKVRV